eukprot:m.18281 g.18281  ORF g.18281 m.18281 type:complete len:233 (+) comp7768_c0_seq1:247-945(+)
MAKPSTEGQDLTEFATYEEFLDAQVSPLDLYYLEDEELARQLVELGFRGTGEVLSRQEFESRKQAAELARTQNRAKDEMILTSEEYDELSPFLAAIAEREEPNKSGKMMTILYLRTRNTAGQEISAYIDLSERFKEEDFHVYFSGKRKLMPKGDDLSFYNWVTQTSRSRNSMNYQVVADEYNGLLFKNKKDRKIVNVDPELPSPGDNTTRTVFRTDEYLQVVFYDHVTRLTA